MTRGFVKDTVFPVWCRVVW